MSKKENQLPKGWEYKKLKDICEKITDGTHQTPKYFESGFIFLSSKNVTTGKINWEDVKYIDEVQHCEMQKRVSPKKGDILLAKNGTTGVAALVDKDTVFDIYVSLALLRSKGEVLPEFLLYFINSPVAKSQFNKRLKGIGVPNLHLEEIREVDIPYPNSHPEQQRIVSILDEACAAIAKAKANAEQNLKNAKELFESYLQGVFEEKGEGWEEKKLGEVVIYDKKQSLHKGLPYVGLEHIESNSGRFLGCLDAQVVKSSTFYFDEQHVLYGRLRPYLNKVLLPNFRGHCSTEIFPIKVCKLLTREFLFYWLISMTTVNKIDATWTGARMPRANMNQVLEFDFSFPSVKEQQTIVHQLDTLRAETQKLEAIYKKKLTDLEELKKSVLQKAFGGEL